MANRIGIILNNVEFSKSYIDGGSDMVIEGIDYNYIVEKEFEYLIFNSFLLREQLLILVE